MASSVSVWLSAALTKEFQNGQRMRESKIAKFAQWRKAENKKF